MNQQTLTAIIVDDEPLAREGLRLRLEKIADIKVIGEASDGDEAIQLCQELEPNVMFLDLNLPGLNGIEVVQAMQSDVLPMVVFVSAYGEYALDAFEVNAIDYVLKPASLARLQKSVARIKKRFITQDSDNDKFRLIKALGEISGISVSELEEWLKSDKPLPAHINQELVIKNKDNEKVFLAAKDIRWIDAAGDYMCIHTETETHVVRTTMKKLAAQLEPNVFKRIHKSTMININYIKSLRTLRNNECIVELGDEVQLKVSRNYSASIKELVESKLI